MRQSDFAVLLLACILSGACSPARNKAVAIAATDEFHRRFNNSTFNDIYDNAEPGLKERLSKQDFLASIEAMRSGQGAVLESKEIAIDYNYSSEGNMIKLVCEVTYEKGIAKEEFIWTIKDGKGVLHGYRFLGPPSTR